jgi:hypothetical protein
MIKQLEPDPLSYGQGVNLARDTYTVGFKTFARDFMLAYGLSALTLIVWDIGVGQAGVARWGRNCSAGCGQERSTEPLLTSAEH